MVNRFGKSEKLSSRISIEALFASGDSFISYPLRFVYLEDKKLVSADQPQVLISVSKRYFKRAVKRNLLKRRMREAYRLNNHLFKSILLQENKSLIFGVLFIGKEVHSFDSIQRKMLVGLENLKTRLTDEDNK